MPQIKVLISNMQKKLDVEISTAKYYDAQKKHDAASVHYERAEGIWQSIQMVKEWKRNV